MRQSGEGSTEPALLYALVVAGPFLAAGFLFWLALRLRRRQVETRLLEQN